MQAFRDQSKRNACPCFSVTEDSCPGTYSANYSALRAFSHESGREDAGKAAAKEGGSAYEKTPVSIGKLGGSKCFSQVRAEGFEPSTQGLKFEHRAKKTQSDSNMLQRKVKHMSFTAEIINFCSADICLVGAIVAIETLEWRSGLFKYLTFRRTACVGDNPESVHVPVVAIDPTAEGGLDLDAGNIL